MLSLALAAALLLPQDTRTEAISTLAGLFPTPSGPMTLVVDDPENADTCWSMVEKYGELTGQHITAHSDTQSLLMQSPVHLDRNMTIPADEVQTTFEHILFARDFVLTPLKRDGMRLLEIQSLSTPARSNIRSAAIFLEPEDLHLAAAHPAMIFTTVVTLPHTDVRQVSNSMRTMITDANTQQLLPAGNSNSMVIVGIGQSLVGLADTLRTIDAAAADGAEKYVTTMELIRLENAVADDVVTLLNAAFGVEAETQGPAGLKFLPDARTNSILVNAPASRLERIKQLIAALDGKGASK
ncbi:Putative type II secretion system protein D precursor [Planctomycetes bacterium Poly30]|uniref:Type II secretion system protein D n=1 Tax=Saltatorellus ferox TaxID=2528018 RepID=A0A518EMD0_9BACT|nr:Putative type II secretion system protein D precursor [Planctomycetes bacterium Poly30]